MNIAQPVSSEVESVEFTFLSPEEILAVSVKRIENESTFDSLLNPVDGGLYDLSLGSWGDEPRAARDIQATSNSQRPYTTQSSWTKHTIYSERPACIAKAFDYPQKTSTSTLTRYLNMRAFSCGMDDLRLTAEGETSRQKELQAIDRVGLEIASDYVSLGKGSGPNDSVLLERLEEVIREDKKLEGLDLLMNQGTREITDSIQKACIPNSLAKPFPWNQMQVMTISGAKGSKVNASLISCNLGQQVLEGRRVPIMVSGKLLPCFQPFETNITANGYIGSRFLTGIRPQEYFFHHMTGREGLIDTAVKTSRSGYLQRCVIKGLEGLMVGYDTTVRDSDGSISNSSAQLRYAPQVVKRLAANRDSFTKYMKSALKHSKAGDANGRDPLMSAFNPAINAFVLSEAFYDAMLTYLKENAEGLIREKIDTGAPDSSRRLNRKNAELLFALKYLQSLVEPSEAVGIVASQSVGEPSTQITLNTFHLAGHAAKNVTAGIPRLIDILITASKDISTPAISLYPHKKLSADEVETFAKSISALPLSYVLDSVAVEEKFGRGKSYGLAKVYTIRLKFFPSPEYFKAYHASTSEVLDAVEKKLLRQVVSLSKAEVKKRTIQATAATPVIRVTVGVVEVAAPDRRPEHGGDDNDAGDDDHTTVKQRANSLEAVSYGPNDDADDEVQRAMDGGDALEAEGVDRRPQAIGATNQESDEEKADREGRQSAKPRAERVLEAFPRGHGIRVQRKH